MISFQKVIVKSDDFIPEGDGQVASGSPSLPDPLVLETEEQRLESEQNERNVFEALGDCKCDTGMSVENVNLYKFCGWGW